MTREGNAYVLIRCRSRTRSPAPLDRLAGVVTSAAGFERRRTPRRSTSPVAGAVAAGTRPAQARRTRARSCAGAKRRRRSRDDRNRDRVGAGRRHSSEPHAVRVSRAVAQGAGLRDAQRHAIPRCATKQARSRPASSSTFVALGAVLAGAARGADEQLGWGFQLQSPAVVTALAMLFFVLALNLSGVFEFGSSRRRGVTNWTAKNRTLDAFGSGVLAVVIASPCTAPFMGAALGFALAGIRGDDAGDLRRARHRHGVALCTARVVPRLAPPAAAAGPVARALQAGARVSACMRR